MLGFAMFVMVIVVGILTLVGGLRLLSGDSRGSLPPSDDGRIDRLESALSSMEARLDDLQEQQRFLERLLADRPSPKSLASGDDSGDEPEGGPGSGSDSILFDSGEAP